MTSRESQNDLERRALELLPWYVNGTLDGDERELVRRQTSTSLACRKELERLRRLQGMIRRDDGDAVAADRAFERLMARIESDQAKPRAGERRAWWGMPAMRIAAAAVIAAVAILWWRPQAPEVAPGNYETLSAPQPAATVRVIFAPAVTAMQRQELLASHGLQAVGAPAADGAVTLSFAEGADRAAVLAALRRDPRILLVTTPPQAGAP